MLRSQRIDAIVSSPALRCRATVEPLARDRDLPVKTSKRVGEGRGEDALDLVLDTVVDLALCTHGDVIEHVLEQLRWLGWAVPARPRNPKGGVWALSRERCTFLPPLA